MGNEKRQEITVQSIINEPAVAYLPTADAGVMNFIQSTRKGFTIHQFQQLSGKMKFSLQEWCNFLHLSERTLQRYKKNNSSFDSLQSERILEIVLLNKYGVKVFGSQDVFYSWLKESNVAMGGVLPVSLLNNTFGIQLIKQELGRIEYGVLA